MQAANGKHRGFATPVQDVPESGTAGSSSLAVNEELLHLALDAVRDYAIFMIDPKGRVTTWNAGAEHIKGYRAEEIVGEHISRFYTDEAVRRGWPEMELARAAAEGRFEDEGWRVRKDGSQFWANVVFTAVRDQAGSLQGFLKVTRDLTERKRTEDAASQQNVELEERVRKRTAELQKALDEGCRADDKFRLVVESAPNGMLMIDAEGRIVLINAQTEKLFGYSRDELLGQAVELLMPERFRAKHPAFRDGFFTCPSARPMGAGRYLSGRRKDGHEFPVEIGLMPIEAAEGQFVLAAIVDITERMRAQEDIRKFSEALEQRVAERTALLEAANKELEAFSYSVSHDLRAPLRAIDGFTRIVMEDYASALPAEAKAYLRDVRANALRMGQLVDDLLSFSRLGRQAFKKESVAPTDIVTQCLEELQPQKNGRRVEIRVAELPPCQADPSLLKQVWFNLISNALKYTGKRETALIEIGCQPGAEPQQQVYFVKDNGVGFNMRYAHKLFGVFQRLHASEDYEGTGVGLAIVQRIVNRHGGRIWAEAAPDKGATFFFTLGEGSTNGR